MGGRESPFGREFDSLADLISFGVAPAFLVHRVVLRDVFENRPEIGWFIASIYLICGAFRLARFNCLAAMAGGGRRQGVSGFSHSLGGGIGGLADVAADVVLRQGKGFCAELVEVAAAGVDALSVLDDGERGEISDVQRPGFAGNADVHENA